MKFGIEVDLNIDGVEDNNLTQEMREDIKDCAWDIIHSHLMNYANMGYLDFSIEISEQRHNVSGSWKKLESANGIKDLLKACYEIVQKMDKDRFLNLGAAESQVEGIWLNGFEVAGKIKTVLENMDGIKLE